MCCHSNSFFGGPAEVQDGSEHKEFMHGESAATLIFSFFLRRDP
jgi:hypothetical protein